MRGKWRAGPVLGSLGLLVAALFLLVSLPEAYLRYRYGPPGRPSPQSALTLDATLGWRSTENFSVSIAEGTPGESDHRVSIRTDVNGFRVFGDVSAREPKILFIGDSVTQALEVGTDSAYYSVVGRALGRVQVFAYGCGGFGSLQELMAMRRFLPLVQPDLVVWQFSSNDFINNSFALEGQSRRNNNMLKRPYLTKGGAVVAASPAKYPSSIVSFAVEHSRLLLFVLWRLGRLQAQGTWSVEDAIASRGEEHEAYRESVAVTQSILAAAGREVGRPRFVVFAADDVQPYYASLRAILAGEDIEFVQGVAEALRAAERRHEAIRARDGVHWNESGHAACGGALVAALRNHLSLHPRRTAIQPRPAGG